MCLSSTCEPHSPLPRFHAIKGSWHTQAPSLNVRGFTSETHNESDSLSIIRPFHENKQVPFVLTGIGIRGCASL